MKCARLEFLGCRLLLLLWCVVVVVCCCCVVVLCACVCACVGGVCRWGVCSSRFSWVRPRFGRSPPNPFRRTPPFRRTLPPPDRQNFAIVPPGLHTTPENSNRAHFRAPTFQTPPKFHKRTRKKGKKEIVVGEGKRNFGPSHPSGPPLFLGLGPHPWRPPPFGAPQLAPPSTDNFFPSEGLIDQLI